MLSFDFPIVALEGFQASTCHVLIYTGNEDLINMLKVMQTVSGSVSITHVEDTCRAHIFVAENESASGRYICCAVNTSLPELSTFLAKRFPEYKVPTK